MSNASTREEKRAAILRAALELFAERGYHATNVPLIAEHAGVSVGTLYHYFENKEDVVNELYRKLKGEMIRAFWEDYPRQAPPAEQFRVFWQRGAAYALANPLAFSFLELHHHDPYLDEESRTLRASALATEGQLFEAGRQQGELKNLPNAVLSAFVDGALVSLVKSSWNGEITLTPEVVAQAADRCWEAIRNKQKEPVLLNQFTLAGEQGRVLIGYEPTTGGRAVVEIESWNYRAKGKAWIDAALLRQFRDELRHCYDQLDGVARLVNNPEQQNLVLEVAFERRNGNVTIRGSYRETIGEENELRFRIQSDQSYVANALAGLDEVLARL